MCNLILVGYSFSGISVVIQGHLQDQKVSFKGTKCENVIQKENWSEYDTSFWCFLTGYCFWSYFK